MQNLQDLQQKIFLESKNIIEKLGHINSETELISHSNLLAELQDRISFLKILEENKNFLEPNIAFQNTENQNINREINTEGLPLDESHDLASEPEMGSGHVEPSSPVEIVAEKLQHEISEGNSVENDNNSTENVKASETNEAEEYQKRVEEKERELHELEERRRKIVEISRQNNSVQTKDNPSFETDSTPHHHHEKKFKLANIKGLKSVQNLFDEDPLEKIQEDEKHHVEKPDSGSLLKTNISTDFMEAEKKKPDFKLDLNDRVAFTKNLFKGNDDELRFTIEKLNSYTNVEDAKQYLSEIYYLKDWRKSDEYAQRLWKLVENKFL